MDDAIREELVTSLGSIIGPEGNVLDASPAHARQVVLPFLVIDMVVSSLLISMGMMMLPPVLVSLPFKLLLFVLVDGWGLIVTSLVSSYG